jgi:hypothetical protein
MAHTGQPLDYLSELLKLREDYVSGAPWQRLAVIRLRLKDQHIGPNRLVTSVSAVEALARSLVIHHLAKSREDLKRLYPRYRDRSPKTLVKEYISLRGKSDPESVFGDEQWRLFGFACEYRNLLAHECTYLGQDKFPALILACETVLEKLAQFVHKRGKRT